MTDFVWQIEDLDRRPKVGDLDDVVTNVYYRVLAQDGEHNSDTYGCCPIGDPGDDFKPFADLTKDDCKGWVLQALAEQQTSAARAADEDADTVTPDDVEKSMESDLEKIIDDKKQPSILIGVPEAWAA